MGAKGEEFKKRDDEDNAEVNELEEDDGMPLMANIPLNVHAVDEFSNDDDSVDEDEDDDNAEDDSYVDEDEDDDDEDFVVEEDEEDAEEEDTNDGNEGDLSPNDDTENESENESDTSSIQSLAAGRDDAEEDDLIKLIKKSKKIKKSHPPDITNDDAIVSISFSPSDDLIAVGTMEGDVYIYSYDLEKTELQSKYSAHVGSCRKIEYDESGELLYSISDDKSIIIAETSGGKFKNVYDNAHESAIYSLTIINENLFCTGDDQGVLKLWDRRKKEDVFSVKIGNDYISSLRSIDESSTLACTAGDGIVTGININTRRIMSKQVEAYDAEITCSGLFYSNTKLAVGTSIGSLLMYSWGQFTSWNDEFPGLDKQKHAINCMVPITENIVITGLDNGRIRATNLFPMRHIGIVGQHGTTVESLDVNRDGNLIASSSIDNKVRFWNVEYFEDVALTDKNKTDNDKAREHNLPSSNGINASDFFSGLA